MSVIGNAPAFQAGDPGSNPGVRSTLETNRGNNMEKRTFGIQRNGFDYDVYIERPEGTFTMIMTFPTEDEAQHAIDNIDDYWTDARLSD